MLPTDERPSAAALRAQIARASKSGDLTAADEARREYRVHQLEDHIARVLSEAPPLTSAQRERLRTLIVAEPQR